MVTFQETVGALCGKPGIYTWQLAANTLKLMVVEDSCGGGARANDFAEHPWVKQT
jgi:hypothetical protein